VINDNKGLMKGTKGCSQTFYMGFRLRDTHLQDTHLLDTLLQDTLLQDTHLPDTLLRDTLLQDTLLRDTLLRDTHLPDTLLQATLHRVVILHQRIMHHMVTLNMDLRQEPILLHMVAIHLRAPLQGILTKGSLQGMEWGHFLLEVQQLQLQLMVLTN